MNNQEKVKYEKRIKKCEMVMSICLIYIGISGIWDLCFMDNITEFVFDFWAIASIFIVSLEFCAIIISIVFAILVHKYKKKLKNMR